MNTRSLYATSLPTFCPTSEPLKDSPPSQKCAFTHVYHVPSNNFLWRILQDLLKVCITSFSRFVLTDLQTDATRRPARVRPNPAASTFISFPLRPSRTPITRDPQQSALVRYLHKLLRRSSRKDPLLNKQPCDPLDVCLFSCL
jgi:hypothetical protein